MRAERSRSKVGSKPATAREPPPFSVRPMEPADAESPPLADGLWAFQPRWPGLRVSVHLHGAAIRVGVHPALRIIDRDGVDVTTRFPELAALGVDRSRRPRVFDGVIVATGGLDGWSDPEPPPVIDLRPDEPLAPVAPVAAPLHALNPTGIAYRLSASSPDDARTRIAAAPVRLLLVDLVHAAGEHAGDLPYAARREQLVQEVPPGAAWEVPPDFTDVGEALGEARRTWGLSSLIAKRLDSRYFADLESTGWARLDFPVEVRATVVGWVRAAHGGHLEQLVIAETAPDGSLQVVGHVAAGLSPAVRVQLTHHLARLATDRAPVAYNAAVAARQRVRWLQPELTVDVAARARAHDGELVDPVVLRVGSEPAPERRQR